jgi:hypothetical protein
MELRKLLDAGYSVTLTADGPGKYEASARLGDGPALTATGTSPDHAAWAASPLHGKGEPYSPLPLGVVIEACLRDLDQVPSEESQSRFMDIVLAARKAGIPDRAPEDGRGEPPPARGVQGDPRRDGRR